MKVAGGRVPTGNRETGNCTFFGPYCIPVCKQLLVPPGSGLVSRTRSVGPTGTISYSVISRATRMASRRMRTLSHLVVGCFAVVAHLGLRTLPYKMVLATTVVAPQRTIRARCVPATSAIAVVSASVTTSASVSAVSIINNTTDVTTITHSRVSHATTVSTVVSVSPITSAAFAVRALATIPSAITRGVSSAVTVANRALA
mmetsp:Transcript_62822/g.103648  ORF Transcript_62822/g.103648 Transcript_62822/m.103648 type:complete len:201 (+) Transcript_62822:253-855(+)